VDDNEVNRLVMSKTLAMLGIEVAVTESGVHALQWLEARAVDRRRCDLVILDAQMPDMDGFEVAHRISMMPSCAGLPMVMLSSAGIKGDVQRSRDVGILGYISKPASRDELTQLMTRILGRGLHSSAEAPQNQAVTGKPATVSSTLHVLLVEDNAINQKLAVTLLERWGHKVTVADNGSIAVDLVAQNTYDVVLMDMMMPVMNGVDATKIIRENERKDAQIAQSRSLAQRRRLPIIAMTANAMEADRELCISAGMDDYLSKPIRSQELQEMLQKLALEQASTNAAAPTSATSATVAQAPSIPRRTSTFDYSAGLQAMDQEIFEIIAQVFIDNWPEDLQRMRTGLENGDCTPLLHSGHALKGTLAMFGAQPASELAARIEECAGRTEIEALPALMAALEVEVARLLPEIKKVLAAGPG